MPKAPQPAAAASLPVGTARQAFNAKSTAKEVVDRLAPGGALRGRVAVVTGGNAGLGLETVKALASAGCRVVLACRDPAAGSAAVAAEVKPPGSSGYAVPDADVVVLPLDLADLTSVVSFAQNVVASEQRLDYVVLNAGVMALEQLARTKDGFEMQIGVNHFGHALLTRLLRPKLEAQEHQSRVVVLSSVAHTMAKGFNPEDLNFRASDSVYRPWPAYGNSKLANLLFAKALAKRLPGDGRVVTASVHPGVIRTSLWRHTPASNPIGGWLLSMFFTDKSVPQGTATTLWACLSDEVAAPGNSGRYLADCYFKQPTEQASSDELADRLWEVTEAELDAALARRGLDPMGNKVPQEAKDVR